MLVLGIESSCDETGIALVGDEGLIAQALHTQIAMHKDYGGVVPELASRDHILRLLPLVEDVLTKAGKKVTDLTAIAVTEGPGLAGALLTGVATAHALGMALNVPVIGVHHMEGHLLANLLSDTPPQFPFVALLVSGGHTQIMRVDRFDAYELLGDTLDDAAGEAFDKVAQLLGESYPGGPAVSRLAAEGTPGVFQFPRPMIHLPNLDMSFSGLKTAVLTAVRNCPQEKRDETFRRDIARGFVDAVVDVLAAKCMKALKMTKMKTLVAAGGVSANQQLRERLVAEAKKRGASVHFPPAVLCTDNGAMIAIAGMMRLKHLSAEELAAHRKNLAFAVRPRWSLKDASRDILA
ncbi:MAG TPA: tRNA (adenosine(37)-N6)-threonylcarbamoyltransferase complex transferase subunit TsaD [Sutterella sp.]|nr:tRNA (adenosine(37)-N6)-threonylcarbamoyltransferase complex transferase subunit TsaD [Sutterella sp.]